MKASFQKMTEDEITAICAMRTRGAPITEIAAQFGRSFGAISYQLRARNVRIVTHSAHAAGVSGEGISDVTDRLRHANEAKACSAHLLDLETHYPDGPPTLALPTSFEGRQLRVSIPSRFSMVGSPAAMCEG